MIVLKYRVVDTSTVRIKDFHNHNLTLNSWISPYNHLFNCHLIATKFNVSNTYFEDNWPRKNWTKSL